MPGIAAAMTRNAGAPLVRVALSAMIRRKTTAGKVASMAPMMGMALHTEDAMRKTITHSAAGTGASRSRPPARP